MAKKQYNVKTSAVAATERRARKYGVAAGTSGSGTYIDVVGDVAGKLDRGVFESMFERIVTGTDDNGNEKWYIKAKATLVSVGDMVAYGVSDITGGGGGGSSTLANLSDTLFGTLMDGDIIKYDASLGKWVNGQGGGGLDESSLAAYLTANNYVTSAVLGDYVTIDTEQTISGKKTFGADETFFTRCATINGDFSGPESCPHIMWHVPNKQYTKMLMDVNGNLHLLWGGATDLNNYRGLTVSSIAKDGGTSSQFLKADGSVDGNHYLAYVPQNGGLKSQIWPDTWGNSIGSIVAEFTDSSGSSAFKLKKDNPSAGKMSLLIDGTVYINEGTEAVASQQWAVNKAGDSMTGDLYAPHLLVGITQSEVLNSWPIYNNNYWHIIVGGKPAHNGGSINIMRTADSQQTYISWLHKNQDHFGIGAASNSNEIEINNHLGGINIASMGSFTYNGNTIWHAGNDGSGSGLDADLLDGRHGGDYLGCRYLGSQIDTHGAWVVLCPAYAGSLTNGGWFYGSVTITRGNAGSYNSKTEVLVQCGGQYSSNQGGYQVLYQNVSISGLHVISYNGTRYIALGMDAASTMRFRVWGQWSGLEPFLIDSAASGLSYVSAVATTPHINTNASSATKLQTARTLYVTSYNNYRAGDGVAFDGTGNVTLKLPNSITASDWFRSYGATGWYNETYHGGIYMEDATWVRVFNDKGFYCKKEIQTSETFNRTVYGGSSWNNGYGAYNVDVYNNSNQTPLLLAYRDGAGAAATGANRLFAMELLNSGTQLNFGFGGAAKFYFYSGGTFVATGDVTAYSDARLKSDIRPLTNRGFIEPKTYIKDGKRSIGFLAQDVRAIYPELVTETGGADNWLALNYGNLVAVLEAQIIDHEERIKRLEERA